MVSPQNPLKPTAGMAPFDERLAGAEALADHPAISVTDIERRLGTRYTAHTLAALNFCFPRMHFVWVMGADNLVQIAQWRQWTRVFNLAPIAVFDRAPYSFDALAGKAAQAFSPLQGQVEGRSQAGGSQAAGVEFLPYPAASRLGDRNTRRPDAGPGGGLARTRHRSLAFSSAGKYAFA